jgi:hypothetical protein
MVLCFLSRSSSFSSRAKAVNYFWGSVYFFLFFLKESFSSGFVSVQKLHYDACLQFLQSKWFLFLRLGHVISGHGHVSLFPANMSISCVWTIAPE